MQRTYDQLSQDLCINNNPATILVNGASVYGMNDITHLGLYDIPMISNIPNMVYLAPTSKEEYFAMLDWSIEQTKYPVAIRIPCNGVISDKRIPDKKGISDPWRKVKTGRVRRDARLYENTGVETGLSCDGNQYQRISGKCVHLERLYRMSARHAVKVSDPCCGAG